MTADPRAALSALVAALETHLETAAVSRGEDDPSVIEAYERVAEAFTAYDDALMDAYGEVTPLEVYDEDLVDDDEYDYDDDDDDDDDDEDDDDDDDDDDGDEDDDDGGGDLDEDDDDSGSRYLGLDDEQFDLDDRPRG
ncbi:hypothetical protein [Ornithinimicrobium avium]|uniref:hypothetical protein n=1 Tax=Ornithinimicrobium avium TaxID=2283195 RepID=UPI00192E09DF|nr:hypothetical protein [Ornithinimicrobium avium]